MNAIELVPFADEHLEDAARLLAARHARHREAEPLLPELDDPPTAVEKEWRMDGASGVFAGEAYLIAAPFTVGGITWMRVGIAGQAIQGDREAMRETAPEEPFDAGVAIRPGTPEDFDDAARLELAMSEAMRPSPSFSDMPIQTQEEVAAEWREDGDSDEYELFVAERDGRIVGEFLLYRRPPDLRVPANGIDLAGASTEPEARGTGVGRALTAHVIRWAHEHGYPLMTTDWRITNLWASRFWPKRGFRTTFLRLYRAIP